MQGIATKVSEGLLNYLGKWLR